MITLKLKNGNTKELKDNVQYWWVNQGKTFDSDRLLNRISCRDNANGKYHKSLCETNIGDIILHYSKGEIKAISYITKGCYYHNSRRINDCKYHLLKSPIKKEFIITNVNPLPRPPFNFVNNGIQQSYFFKIDKLFFDKLFNKEIECI